MLSALGPRDIIDELYVRSFPRCAPLHSRSSASRRADERNSDNPVASTIKLHGMLKMTLDRDANSKRDNRIQNALNKPFMQTMMSASAPLPSMGTAIPVSCSANTIVKSNATSVHHLTGSDILVLAKSKDINDFSAIPALRLGTTRNVSASQSNTIVSSTIDSFPAPKLAAIAEASSLFSHMLGLLWGCELHPSTSNHFSQTFAFFDATKTSPDFDNPVFESDDRCRLTRPLLSLVAIPDEQASKKVKGPLRYFLFLHRFHSPMRKLFGADVLCDLLSEPALKSIPRDSCISRDSDPATGETESHFEWSELKARGTIKAVLNDIVAAVEFVMMCDNKHYAMRLSSRKSATSRWSVNAALWSAYYNFETPPASASSKPLFEKSHVSNAGQQHESTVVGIELDSDVVLRKTVLLQRITHSFFKIPKDNLALVNDYFICAVVANVHGLLDGLDQVCSSIYFVFGA
jgi:hypothetical protein